MTQQTIENASRIGFNFRSANERVALGKTLESPADLYRGLWYQGELAALYADTNTGKSILATQIADAVARRGFKTLYVDFELTDKSAQMRACDPDTGEEYVFSDNLHTLTVNFSRYFRTRSEADDEGFAILDDIENYARELGIEAIILDNITTICPTLENGEAAVRLVNRLLSLRDDNGWSVLFLAHTPKLDRTQPITVDSMAGSKRVISLIDSAFAIGKCLYDPDVRYIKQTKVRLDRATFDENNVMTCQIERRGGLLQFVDTGVERERDLLRTSNPAEKTVLEIQREKREEFRREAKELLDQGLSVADVAELMKVARNTIYRLKKTI